MNRLPGPICRQVGGRGQGQGPLAHGATLRGLMRKVEKARRPREKPAVFLAPRKKEGPYLYADLDYEEEVSLSPEGRALLPPNRRGSKRPGKGPPGEEVIFRANPHLILLLFPIFGLVLFWQAYLFLFCARLEDQDLEELCYLVSSLAFPLVILMVYLDWHFNVRSSKVTDFQDLLKYLFRSAMGTRSP